MNYVFCFVLDPLRPYFCSHKPFIPFLLQQHLSSLPLEVLISFFFGGEECEMRRKC